MYYIFCIINKNEKQTKYHTVGTVPKTSRTIVETKGKNDRLPPPLP
jgi:hypothetical protein